MQRLFLAFAAIIPILLYSCEENGLTTAPEVEAPLEVLNYDGANQDAPEFEGGIDVEGAVRFPSSLISAFEGDEIVRVQYYIQAKPTSATLKIYAKTENNEPGELIYSAAISGEITANSWNEHTLTSPIIITRDDVWISIKFSSVNQQRTLGCDQGPAVSDGDWVLQNGVWEILSSATPININWNIRAVINP